MRSREGRNRIAFASRVTRHVSLLLLLVLPACAVPQVPSRAVYEDPTNFVRLEEDATFLAEWPPSHNSHPATLTAEEIATVLKGLIVQERRVKLQRIIQGESPKVPAFQDEEIALLAPKLSEALAQAQPNERITYYLSRPETSIKRIITTGGLYLKGSELHFILGNWRVTYGIPAYGVIYDRRYPMSPTAAKGFDLFFEQSSAVIRQESGVWDRLLANSKDEFVIDLTKVFLPSTVSVPRSHRTVGSTSKDPVAPAA